MFSFPEKCSRCKIGFTLSGQEQNVDRLDDMGREIEAVLKIVAQERSSRLDVMESSSSSKTSLEGSTKIILKLTQAPLPQKDIEKQSKQCAQALQPLKAYEKQPNQCTQVDFRQQKPEWLERFFTRTFFDPCSEHPIRRNELNKYCIDCDASLCQYCLSLASHVDHRLLKIYRHVYKDVVPLDEIERHIDCTQIQPYRCNRQMVIALTPLPHSGAKTNDEATCQTCRRKLIEYDVYSYCSISCKVEAFARKKNDSAPPFLSLDQSVKTEKKLTRKRKGIPHRSPLF